MTFPVVAQVSLIKKDESCAGRKDGSIEVVVEGIDGPFHYAWEKIENGAFVPLSSNEKKLSGLAPGDYSVTVSLVDGGCMDTKAAKIWPGKVVSVDISARLIDVSPHPVPCGVRPTFTYRLTAIPSGGTPPYYCSWGEGGDMEGGCSKIVSGQFIDEAVVLIDDVGCVDSDGFSKKAMKKVCPKDPNDIEGPEGFADERWISVHDEINYTIRFENDPEFATSNAAIVLVTVPIDDDIDPFSFRLGTLGFGDKIIEVPANASYFQQRLDYSADLGFMVDVTSGLDLPNNRYFWLIETIDPATGQPPTDPTSGFLPVNDTLTGSGEGFINFTCQAKAATLTGEIVSHQASIIFDFNEPLLTNLWDNKIDAFPPTTTITAMPDTFDTNAIPFAWIIQDDNGGCGVQHAQVFLSTDGVEFESNGFIVDALTDTLSLQWGTTYYYMILGSDNVDNREDGYIDSFYIVPQRSIEFITPDQDIYCIGDTLMVDINLVTLPSADLYISIDSGMTYSPLATAVNQWPYPLVLDSAYAYPHLFIKARHEAQNIEEVSDPFAVNFLPVIDAVADPTEGCANEILFVEAEGANDYRWWPDSIIGNPTGRFSNVYADESQFVYVRGTDVSGCSAIDSVFLTVHPLSRDTVQQPLCEGDSILIGGEWIKEQGFYVTTFANTFGCDSSIISEVYYQYPCIWSGGPYVYVDEDATGANNGTSWQDAFQDLNDAIYVAGRYENVQEIWVAEGVYRPHPIRRDTSFILLDSIKIYGGFLGIESSLAERSADPDLVHLSGDINQADTLWDNSYHTIKLSSTCKECVVDGLTITYGYADETNNGNNTGAGVLNEGVGHFTNVIFERNYATDLGAALYSTGMSANLVIENCTFRLNTSSLGRDIVNLSGSQVEFKGANGIH